MTMTPESRLLSHFEAGRSANRADRPRAANPHRPSEESYEAWDCGWLWECGLEEVYVVRERAA